MTLCSQLLQGIVHPLKSAHHSSAIQRSRSAADVVLQAANLAVPTNGSTDQDAANRSWFSSLPSASSRATSCLTSTGTETSGSAVGTQSEKKVDLIGRKTELDAGTMSLSTRDAEKAVDLNENVINSGQAVSGNKAAVIFKKPSDDTTRPSSIAIDQSVSSDLMSERDLSSQAAKSDSEDGVGGGTRSWVSSSSYRQKLGSAAASRYQSITSRLYGDSWLSSLSSNLSNAASRRLRRSRAETLPLSTDSSDIVVSTVESTAALSCSISGSGSSLADSGCQATASESGVHPTCSTSSSSSTVERPSLTSDSGDEEKDEVCSVVCTDDDDEEEEAGEVVTRSVQPPDQSDAVLTDEVRWRQRLAASPPPRRACHVPRRFEDHDKEHGTGVTHGHSLPSSSSSVSSPEMVIIDSPKSSESSKHVSFDPFTLSLNAALEGELDVLQALFSQVAP